MVFIKSYAQGYLTFANIVKEIFVELKTIDHVLTQVRPNEYVAGLECRCSYTYLYICIVTIFYICVHPLNLFDIYVYSNTSLSLSLSLSIYIYIYIYIYRYTPMITSIQELSSKR